MFSPIENLVRINENAEKAMKSLERVECLGLETLSQFELVKSFVDSLTGPLLALRTEYFLNYLKGLEFQIEVTAHKLSNHKAMLAKPQKLVKEWTPSITLYEDNVKQDTYRNLVDRVQRNLHKWNDLLMVVEKLAQNIIECFRDFLKRTIRLGLPDFKHHDSSFDGFYNEKRLDMGSYGCVDKVSVKPNDNEYKEHALYARKTILRPGDLEEDAFDILIKEYWILKDINNLSEPRKSFFVNLKEAYTIDLNTQYPQFFLVMYPVANGGNLTKYLLNPSPQAEVLSQMMGRLVVGLAILHKACIRHHDIHPGNILIHDGFPLYTDFGLAYSFKLPSNSRTRSTIHRHHWNFGAPEEERSTKSDVFALGGVLYEIAAFLATKGSGMLDCRATISDIRFGDEQKSSQARGCLRKEIKRNSNHGVKIWLRVILRMLSIEPDSRPTAMEIIATIKEEFGLMKLNTPFCAKCEHVINILDRELLEPKFMSMNDVGWSLV